MKRIILASVAILVGIGAVAAQQDQSKALMKSNGKNLGGVLSPMVKGEKPYDQTAVTAALAQLDDTAKKLPTLYPDSLKSAKAEGDYSPSPKIWENKSDFEAKIAGFAKAVTDAKAQVKDLDSLKVSLPNIGKACSACHETYRVKNS
jgi:cytochrome c556